MIKKSKNRLLSLLFVLIFMLSVPLLFSNHNNFDNDTNLETSATNILFNGKSYPFELKDVYDDENYTKIYTDAYLQTEYNQNGTIIDDQVSVVNNTCYKSPSVDGHYPATYSFDDQPVGTSGTDINWINSIHQDFEAEILSEDDGHKKVMYFGGPTFGDAGFPHQFTGQSVGTIEYWTRLYSGTRYQLIFRSGGIIMTSVLVMSTSIRIYHGDGAGGYTFKSVSVDAGKLNHIKIYWDCITDKLSGWINEVKIVDNLNFYSDANLDTITNVYMHINTANSFGIIDAIGYSWDGDYNVGDNLYSEPVSMLNGTFDNSDNMKANDDNYSNFTSTEAVPVPEEFINDIVPSKGSYYDGLISDTWVDNGVAYRIQSEYSLGTYSVSIDINFDPVEGGRNFYVSAHIGTGGTWGRLSMNGVEWKYSTNIDFDDEVYNGLTSVQYSSGGSSNFWASVYYFKLVEIEDPVLAELNYTVDLDFSELDASKLLALDVSSYHYTNISTTIIGNVYNYTSGTYTEMFSSSNTVETENYFTDNTSISDYLDGSGNLRLYFTGTNSDDFKQIIDYIKVRFYYKMDVTIDKTFYINGIWRYRFKLIGSLHYTDWNYFEVIDPIPNFYAISESDLTTRWILQGAEISAFEDFHDDINANYWNLMDVSILYVNDSGSISYDTYVSSLHPTNNFGDCEYLYVDEWSYDGYTFFKNIDPNYLNDNNTIANSTLSGYMTSGDSVYYDNETIYVHSTTYFDENVVTWNTKPEPVDFLNSFLLPETITELAFSSNLGSYSEYYRLTSREGDNIYFWSSDYAVANKRPIITNRPSKNYFGSGYMYMQTDITESISLKSKDYGTHYNLSSGDYFEVDFQTSSDSQINLILLNDSIVQKTLILSQSGNTNFGRHTAKISVSEFVEFDQLKISSTFEDKDNVKVYDVKTHKHTLTGDHADFYVGSKRDREVYLTPDTYNLRISEEGDEKVNVNVTIPTTGVLDYVYTPIERLECRLALFNTENYPLEFIDYHVKVNRSLNDVYNEFWLLDSIFSADKNTYVYITVYDRFDTLIDTVERLSSEYIDIEIEVYSLQIKNLMTQKTTLTVNSTLYTYPLLSGDSIHFMLSEAHYVIGYYDTNNVDKQFTIYLNSNQAYELNRSRICFLSYADQQGNHLSFENYKTYLNNSLIYENIFYREIGDIVGIEIKDRYGISIKNETYTVISGDNYIPITLTMYSLKIMNQQEIFNWINITRDPNHYESEMYWSEWIAPTEIIEFKLFAGYYKINLTDNENSGSSYYSYTLNGDDILLISSGNTISNLIINIANVNTTIGNQITNVQIDLTNQNSEINNTIINIEINLSNVNSSLGNLLVDLNLGITNIANNISSLYVFTNNSFLNLDNQINNSFIYMENNIISINQSVSTLIIGLDGKISIVNATINTMWTEMSNQFIVTQSTLNFSFAFLNQTIVQIGNNITENKIALQNLIIQRANEIDNSLIQISTLVNLINSSVVNESLVIQSLVNIIGNNITENHIIINDLINLIGNNITENNINMVSLIELTGNNITTNQFVIQTLIDYVSNNITENHLEFLTNINLINNTIGQNQIELINRLLFINNSINQMSLDLTNQVLLVNNTIYSAILDVYTSIEFNSDNILGNISLTYEQNDFLTELYKETMFSQLLNWSDVAFNYSLMESRIDVWEFINNYKNQSIEVHLRYQDIIDNLTITAQNSILQYLPRYDTDYNLWSVEDQEYLDEWQPLPENRTVPFGFYEETIPDIPDFNAPNTVLMIVLILMGCGSVIALVGYMAYRYRKKSENYRRSYADKITLEAKTIKNFSQGTRIR